MESNIRTSYILASAMLSLKSISGLLLSIILLSHTSLAFAEPPESLDFIGGYYENGEYKCYAQPCFSIHKGTEAAASRDRPFNIRDWISRKRTCQKSYTKVLAEASQVEISYAKKGECVFVVAGLWIDPYTEQEISEVRQIALDHRLSFKEAHRGGGAYWNSKQRLAFANDPMDLVPVASTQKKERNGLPASEWMPESKRYWCDYVVHREIVARKYSVRIPRVEREHNKKVKTLYCKY